METIEKTLHTSRPALEKMILATAGSIGKPQKIEKADDTQKFFLGLRAKKIKKDEKSFQFRIT